MQPFWHNMSSWAEKPHSFPMHKIITKIIIIIIIIIIILIIVIIKCRGRFSSNNHVDIKQFNQEYISLNCLTVKDVKFD